MPTPRIPPAQVSRELAFNPDWFTDPAPVWEIIRQLDLEQQAKFAKVVLASQVTALEGQLAARRQVAEGLDSL